MRPVTYSAETLVPIFAQLSSIDDMDPDEELSDSHDADFEIEDDSARKGFDHNELKDLARDLGLSQKVFRLNENDLPWKKE